MTITKGDRYAGTGKWEGYTIQVEGFDHEGDVFVTTTGPNGLRPHAGYLTLKNLERCIAAGQAVKLDPPTPTAATRQEQT